MRCLLLAVCAIELSAAATYNPTEVLSRVIQKAIERARTIPNYTCVETVTRVYSSPPPFPCPAIAPSCWSSAAAARRISH